MEIRIKYQPDSPHLKQEDWGNWIDLYLYEDVKMKAGERKYLSMGVSMELPEGYEAIMAARSSTFKRWGLLQTNSIGIIDTSYCADSDIWMFPALATRDVEIPKGTRLCQFRILKSQPQIDFIEVETLGNKARSGLGHSGA